MVLTEREIKHLHFVVTSAGQNKLHMSCSVHMSGDEIKNITEIIPTLQTSDNYKTLLTSVMQNACIKPSQLGLRNKISKNIIWVTPSQIPVQPETTQKCGTTTIVKGKLGTMIENNLANLNKDVVLYTTSQCDNNFDKQECASILSIPAHDHSNIHFISRNCVESSLLHSPVVLPVACRNFDNFCKQNMLDQSNFDVRNLRKFQKQVTLKHISSLGKLVTEDTKRNIRLIASDLPHCVVWSHDLGDVKSHSIFIK